MWPIFIFMFNHYFSDDDYSTGQSLSSCLITISEYMREEVVVLLATIFIAMFSQLCLEVSHVFLTLSRCKPCFLNTV